MPDEAVVAQKAPFEVELKEGRRYAWCSQVPPNQSGSKALDQSALPADEERLAAVSKQSACLDRSLDLHFGSPWEMEWFTSPTCPPQWRAAVGGAWFARIDTNQWF